MAKSKARRESGRVVRCARSARRTTDDGKVAVVVDWCDHNVKELNVTKTEEMVSNFRCCKSSLGPLAIEGEVGSASRQPVHLPRDSGP